MRLNRYTWQVIVLTVVACAIAVVIGRHGTNSSRCTVALVPRTGMTILSDNPVHVKRGGSASFQVQFDEGFFHNESSGLRYTGDMLYVDDVRDSRSVQYIPWRYCALSVDQASAGNVEFMSGNQTLYGETAQIRVQAPEHYTVKKVFVNEDAYLMPSTGILSFPVYDDCQISLELQGEPVDFTVTTRPLGTVENFEEREEYRYGDTVTLLPHFDSASVRFDGWSTDAYLNQGGTLLSQESELSFTLETDTEVFANFTDLHTYTVAIDPNGGISDAVLARSDCSAGQSIFLPADTGVLHRDGYALIGYNTMPDGSGRHYAPASPIMVSALDVMLYAEWVPNTSEDLLTWREVNGSAVVTGLTRDPGGMLVIPPQLGRLSVRSVDASAFSGNTSLHTVLIPLGVTHIGEGAFSGCSNLSMVYLPDTLEELGDRAFDDCPAFVHLRILSENDNHVYEQSFDTALADRYMDLITTEGKRIILVAGSSGSFGMRSNLLAERWPDYNVINFSGSYLYGIQPILYYVMNNVHPGDVVIFAPEYYDTMYANKPSTDLLNWFYLESNYNMLDDLNLQAVKQTILGTYIQFLYERRKIMPGKQPPDSKIYARTAFNEYGDLSPKRTHHSNNEEGPFEPDPDLINSVGINIYSDAFSEITARGGVCLFSFPPVSDGGVSRAQYAPSYEAFTQMLTEAFALSECTVISNAADYVFPKDMFYDNRYHMTSDGAILRTNQLISDLEAFGLGQ